MGLFGKKKPKLPSYLGASLEALLEDPQWSFAIGEAGIDPSRCEVVLRLAHCTISERGMPVNARPALLLGQGKTLAVAFPGERDIQVVKRDTSRAELQTQRSGMFQILFGSAGNLMDGFMFWGDEDNLKLDTLEGDQFGKAMSAFLNGNLNPQAVVGTPQTLAASAPSSVTSAPPSSAPEFDDPEDATRWQMVLAVHSALIDMMDKYQLCFEKAEKVEQAFGMANAEFVDGVRQHEISRQHFQNQGVEWERELEGLLQNLRAATVTAQSQWNNLMFLLPGEENDIMKLTDWCMANGVDTEVVSSIASNGMFTHTDFGTTRASFWTENERIISVLKNADHQS